MKLWNKNWNIPAFLIFNIVLFSFLFYFDLNKNINIGVFEAIGTVSFKINSIQRKFESAVVWHSIGSNAPLKNRDTIKTYPESDAIIKLKDGTEIQVDENSMIYLDLIGTTPNIHFEGGSIQINNSKGSNPNQELIVKMKNQTVKLSGSDAKIDSSENGKDINISIEKGTAVIEGNGKSQKINSNEIAIIGESGISTRKAPYILQEPENHKKFISTSFPTPISFLWKATGVNTNMTFELSTMKDFKRIEASVRNISSANLNLTPGIYYWRVSGKNSSGDTEISEFRKIILLKESGLQLFSPQNGATTNYSSENKNISFSWTPSETVNEYFVEIATNAAFTSNFKIIPVNTNSVSLNNLGEGTYFWRVVTKPSIDGIPAIKSKVSTFTISSKLPAVVAKPIELITPADNANLPLNVNVQKNLVLFSWKSNSSVKKFRIQITNKSNFKDLLINELVTEKIFSYNINKEGVYFWNVTYLGDKSQETVSKVRKFTVLKSKDSEKSPEEVKIDEAELKEANLEKRKLEKQDAEKPKVEVESISNLTPQNISPVSGKVDIQKEKQIRFRWDKVKNASYYIVKIMETVRKNKPLIIEKTIQNFLILKNFSKLNEGIFLWEVTPYDKTNKQGKTARGKFIIDLGNDGLKNLKPEEIKILSPDTIYRDK